MLEHLRLRNATCAAPGCPRPTSIASEADHIQPYDHDDPEQGGLTSIENLHLLCWQHHRVKTSGILEPTRLPKIHGQPGETVWQVHGRFRTRIADDTDLATPSVVEEFTSFWNRFERHRVERGERRSDSAGDTGHPPPAEPPPRYPDPPF